MKQIEINTFNQFLIEAGIRDEYTAQFANSRIDKTDNIDSFMSSVKSANVFTDGFNPELISDIDWQAAANLWKEYRDEHLPSKPVFKFCPCCWQLKPISSFNVHTQEANGFSVYCRECVTPKKWMENHPDENPKGCMTPYECILLGDHIFLNMEISKLIREKGFKHCGLRHEEGRLFLIFCEKNSKKNLRFSKTGGVSIIDQSLIDDVIRSMKVNFTDPVHLRVTTNKSLKPSAVTIEVLQCFSHEDYVNNPVAKGNDNEERPLDVHKEDDERPDERSCTSGYKFCINCCTPKPVSEFNKNTFNFDGYHHYCRECVKSKDTSVNNKIPISTAILFGDKIFFSPEVSNMIKISLSRSCTVMKNNKGCSLFFNKSNHDKNPNASMFTSCKSSGVTALKDENEINKLREYFNLDKEYAYNLRLFIRQSTPTRPLVLVIKGFTPYCFRDNVNSDQIDNSEKSGSISDQQHSEALEDSYIQQLYDKIWSDFHLSDIVKELEDPIFQKQVPANIKSQAGEIILWLIREMKKVWSNQDQTDNDKSMDSQTNSDPFKDVIRYLVSNDPTQDMTTKFVKHHDNPDYEESIVALEETFANALKAVGWKLQRPVKVVHYEEF